MLSKNFHYFAIISTSKKSDTLHLFKLESPVHNDAFLSIEFVQKWASNSEEENDNMTTQWPQ